MSPVTPHPSTAALHELLGRYLAEWADAVARELRARRAAPPAEDGAEPAPFRAAYVDAFCSSGGRHVLAGPGRSEAAGSAVRGVRALDRLAERAPGARAPLHTAAVLVEADPAEVERLERDLERAGAGHRVRRTGDPAEPAPGGVALLHAEWAEAAERVARFAAGADRALCFLAPPAPGKLPLASLRPLLALPRADLLLAFPHADLRKLARWSGSPVADLPAHARQLVEGYSALFGEARYEWLSLWRDAEREEGGRAAEARLAEHWGARLAEAAGRPVRYVAVHFSDEPGDSLHLFLAADPLRALALNQALRGAELDDGAVLDRRFRAGPGGEPEEAGVLELFGPGPGDGPAAPAGARPPELALLSRTLRERFRGRTVAYGEVLGGLADTDLTPDEVRRAMAPLKRTGEAVYRSLSPEAEVAFPETPVPPARPRRARRGAEMPLLGGLEPEDDG